MNKVYILIIISSLLSNDKFLTGNNLTINRENAITYAIDKASKSEKRGL